jgi:hypothetical protein
MKTTTHSHNGGGSGAAGRLVDEVVELIKSLHLTFGKNVAPKLRQELLTHLRRHGWSNAVPIKAKFKLTITATNLNVGLCLQTGNASRLYADMLKLQAAFLSGNIEQAIIVVPTRAAAREMGQNIASYDRLVGELGVFRAIITMPIVVVGVSQ